MFKEKKKQNVKLLKPFSIHTCFVYYLTRALSFKMLFAFSNEANNKKDVSLS